MTAVTINGHDYSDDGTTTGDMQHNGHLTHFLPMVGDVVTVAAQVAADAAQVAIDAAAAAAAASPVLSVSGRSGNVTLAKADVGLSNVDNTSDANKPISIATQAALDGKEAAGSAAAAYGAAASDLADHAGTANPHSGSQATLISGTNIKTVNGNNLLGSGDVVISATMVYPGAGLAVSTGSAWGASKAAPTGVIVGDTDTQTLTNKTLTSPTLAGALLTNGFFEETYSANTGTAYTVDIANGSIQKLTLTGNCALTLPTPTAGSNLKLLMIQDATGSRTLAWPANAVWPGGVAPTQTATIGSMDRYDLVADGSRWWCARVGADFVATVPTFVGVSASATGIGGITIPGVPGTLAGDVVLVAVNSNDEAVTTPTGCTLAVTPAGLPGVRTTVFYQVLSGADGDTVIADTGDHTVGVKVAYRGVNNSTPMDATPVTDTNTSTTSFSQLGITTVSRNTLVVAIAGCGYDTASSSFYGPSNAGLTSVTERFDGQSLVGVGGGIVIADGVKAIPGATGDWTVTSSNSGPWSGVTVALRPAGA